MASTSGTRRNEPVARRDFYLAGLTRHALRPEHYVFSRSHALAEETEPGPGIWKEAGLD